MAHKPDTRNGSLAALLLCAALAGCSSGGGSVSIANSQPADSQTTDFAIAYVKRRVPTSEDDLRLRRPYQTGADLYLLNPTSAGGKEQNVTARITSTAPTGTFYDIKDVDVSSDGSRIIFAMRGPITPKQKDFNPPNWILYEYVVATDTLHTVLPASDPTGTGAEYVSPHYLPDGRILFATTRQVGSGAVLINEGKAEFEAQTEDLNESAFVLHVMNADGSGLHQITYNQSHDVDASVLQDGRILWSRWDHANGNDGIHLYTANPDGTHVQLLYGAGSHDTATTNPGGAANCPAGEDCTVQFVRTREMPGGSVLALVRPVTNAGLGGDLEIIDVQHYVENNQPTLGNGTYPSTAVAQRAATANAVLTACTNSCRDGAAQNLPVISPGGRFSSAFPLWDGTGRILVTWSECRLQDKTGTILACTDANLAQTTGATPALTAAPPLYSAWMFNPADNTFKPLIAPAEGVMVTDIVALQPRTAPAYIGDSYTAATQAQGILDIRSVYDWDGAGWAGLANAYPYAGCAAAGSIAGMAQTAADCRPARFLRIVKAVSIPPAQGAKTMFTLNFARGTAFGAAGDYMREILGYVPIEPDGSVRVSVPSNVAFQVDVVSAQMSAGSATGWVWRAFPLHRAWLQLQPGETLSCNGCHTPPSQQNTAAGLSSYSHGRQGLFPAAWSGATATGLFPGTQGTYSACIGETMAEALVGYQCGAFPSAAASLTSAPQFTDPWGFAAAGNEPISNLSYTDPSITTPIPTPLNCALAGQWNSSCRIVIDYPTATAKMTKGEIEPLWTRCRNADGSACAMGVTTGAGTCTNAGCHDNSAAPAGFLSLTPGASNTDANQENSYQQLTQGVTQTTAVNGQAVTTTLRGPEVISGSAAGSNLFPVFTDPANMANQTEHHVGLLSPAELRLLSEWVDIGAQYYNNPFDAPLNN